MLAGHHYRFLAMYKKKKKEFGVISKKDIVPSNDLPNQNTKEKPLAISSINDEIISNLIKAPPDIILIIASYLNLKDLASLSLVSKYLQITLLANESLWKAAYAKHPLPLCNIYDDSSRTSYNKIGIDFLNQQHKKITQLQDEKAKNQKTADKNTKKIYSSLLNQNKFAVKPIEIKVSLFIASDSSMNTYYQEIQNILRPTWEGSSKKIYFEMNYELQAKKTKKIIFRGESNTFSPSREYGLPTLDLTGSNTTILIVFISNAGQANSFINQIQKTDQHKLIFFVGLPQNNIISTKQFENCNIQVEFLNAYSEDRSFEIIYHTFLDILSKLNKMALEEKEQLESKSIWSRFSFRKT